MSYKIEKPDATSDTITVHKRPDDNAGGIKWWLLKDAKQRANGAISTASFLRTNLLPRYRQAALYARLYSNQPLFGAFGGSLGQMNRVNQLPLDRPTMNVVQSCVDTLVSRLTQSRPRPVFLTDNGDYKERNLAKQLNQFIVGELYRSKAYTLGPNILKDATILGTGVVKIYKGSDNLVKIERVLAPELQVDPSEAIMGDPRQLYQIKLMDREMLAGMNPEYQKEVATAQSAYVNNSDDGKSIADQVMVVEGWHLPSVPGATDGRHIIAIAGSDTPLVDEEYKRDVFPFVFLRYSDMMTGFWGQGLAEQLMGTQMELNKIMMTISRSIHLNGVPRVLIENGSKVVSAHINNDIGAQVRYTGTKPEFIVSQSNAPEIYAERQRLIDFAYQQSGISSLSAASQKPSGLDSGAALREFDDIQSDRFATLSKQYDNMFIEWAYHIIDAAKEIVETEGSYSTVYPNKDGTKEVDLPASKLLKDPYVIQCFDSSALPRDPAGRMQRVVELIQSGMIDIREGRRLLDYPDLSQNEKLNNASEERIMQALDKIVEKGKYTPPDPFMDLGLAKTLVVQYYNLYVAAKLEPARAEMLRTFSSQVLTLMQPPAPPIAAPGAPMAPNAPQAVPEPLPVSDMLPIAS